MVSDLAQLNLKNISATESEWRLNATSDQIYSIQKDDKYVTALVCYLKFGKVPDSSTLWAFVLKLANRAVFRLGIVGILQNGEFLTRAPLVLQPTFSDRPKTFSGEYSAETNIWQVLPITKKVLFSNFPLPSNIFPR
jgi:hypothetical protein